MVNRIFKGCPGDVGGGRPHKVLGTNICWLRRMPYKKQKIVRNLQTRSQQKIEAENKISDNLLKDGHTIFNISNILLQ